LFERAIHVSGWINLRRPRSGLPRFPPAGTVGVLAEHEVGKQRIASGPAAF